MSEHLGKPVTADQSGEEKASLRWPGDGLEGGFTRPPVEPLASRLERGYRVNRCRELTFEMLVRLNGAWPSMVVGDAWVRGVQIDFLTFTWKGVFLIWSIDYRWTIRQAAMVMPARDQIQREMGAEWPGQVEAVFHSPREPTGWFRHVAVDDDSEEPVNLIVMGGDLDELLIHWQPIGGVGLDPDWIRWLRGASEPRWWLSDAGRRALPEPPPHERL